MYSGDFLTVSVADLGVLPSRFAFEDAPSSAYAAVHKTVSMQEILNTLHPSRGKDALETIYAPGGLIKGIIEHAADEGVSVIALKNEATRLALGLFAGITQAETHGKLETLLEREGLQEAPVTVYFEDTTARATNPGKSRASAERLIAKTDAPLLLIPICNGGFAATIQTALYHRRANPKADTIIYPVRFSCNKNSDPAPRMTPRELEYLKELAVGRTVVLHDDDAATGGTLALATVAFASHFPENEILGIVNTDGRTQNAKDRIVGEWWELCREPGWL